MNKEIKLKDLIQYYLALRIGLYARTIDNFAARVLFVLSSMKTVSVITGSDV